ncbi:hypothetical protein CapIbe_022630 [Capra ibex]
MNASRRPMRIWELQSEEVTLLKGLGSDQFGAVHQGKWKGQDDVAVKLIKELHVKDEFFPEAQTMRTLGYTLRNSWLFPGSWPSRDQRNWLTVSTQQRPDLPLVLQPCVSTL